MGGKQTKLNKNQTSEDMLAREKRKFCYSVILLQGVADAGFEQVPFLSCSFIHDDLITRADLKLCFILNALHAGLLQTVLQLLYPGTHAHFRTLFKKEVVEKHSVDVDNTYIF